MSAAAKAEVRADLVPQDLSRILLRLPNWLGDIVMAAPLVAAIHAARPEATLVAQAKPAFLPLASCLPGVGEVVPSGRDHGPREVWSSKAAVADLGVDATVVMPRAIRAVVPSWLARVPVRLGWDVRGRRHLLTHRVKGPRALRGVHRTDWFGALARAFDTEIELPWRLTPPPAARAEAEQLLLSLGRRTDRPLVVLEPGASYGAAKCWPAERFGGLAHRLVETGHDVAIIGTDVTKPIERLVGRHAAVPILRAAGRTPDLAVLIGLLSHADAVVSNDTGPMHVAAAVGTPVLALFGASDPVVSSPTGPGPRRVIYDPEPCSPCFLRTCPVAGHPCLGKVGVERVYAATVGLIPRIPSPVKSHQIRGS